MGKYKNPMEKFRLPGTRDLGEDHVIDIFVIHNSKNEYIAISIGEHGDYFTFGCKVKMQDKNLAQVDMPPSCEYGLFKDKLYAYIYAVCYVGGMWERLSYKAIESVADQYQTICSAILQEYMKSCS